MPFSAGDHIRVILRQTYLTQQVINVLHYEMVDTGTLSAAAAAQAWWDDVKAAWRGATTTSIQFDRVDVYDNDNPLGEFGSYPIPSAERGGTYGTNDFSPNIAAGFKLAVGNRTTKPGALRVAGMRSDGIDDGGNWLSSQVTVLNALGNAIEAFRPGAAGTIGGVLVVYGAPHGPSTRYPARETAVYNPVLDVVLAPYMTTQNTRKYGRGA